LTPLIYFLSSENVWSLEVDANVMAILFSVSALGVENAGIFVGLTRLCFVSSGWSINFYSLCSTDKISSRSFMFAWISSAFIDRNE